MTKDDLEKELGITDQLDLVKLLKDIEVLKNLYSKNSKDAKINREKLLKFYENQKRIFLDDKTNKLDEKVSVSVAKDLKDQKDEMINPIDKVVSSSSSSSSSDSEDEGKKSPKREGSFGKIIEDPNEYAEPSGNNSPTKIESIIKDSQSRVMIDKESEHNSEYHSTINAYKKMDGDLMKTVTQTLGTGIMIPFGEIEFAEKIGEGGYGEVFKARWFGQEVAVKFYGKKKSRKNKERFDSDFLKETEVLGRLRHPNVLLFMGVSFTPQYRGILVTEYLEGGSLFDHLHRRGTNFSDEKQRRIALDIALGMNYLHGKKILHCDLKSSNILIDEHFNIKLADFGLSKAKRISKSKSFKRIGTIHWMAPEVMREEQYDEFSDVYSYGMILWELATRKIPYFGLKVLQIVGSVGFGDNQVKIPEKGNEVILDLIRKCLHKDRKSRPLFSAIVEFLESSNNSTKKRNQALQELDRFFE